MPAVLLRQVAAAATPCKSNKPACLVPFGAVQTVQHGLPYLSCGVKGWKSDWRRVCPVRFVLRSREAEFHPVCWSCWCHSVVNTV